MEKNNFKNQKGVSIYLALVIMAIFLDLSLGMSFLAFSEILTMRDIGNSVVAFYAADTAIEKIFYIDNVVCFEPGCAASGYNCADPTNCNDGATAFNLPIESLCSGCAQYEGAFATTNISGRITRVATSTGFFLDTRRSLRAEY
jgi:hypothetical protein